MEDNIKLTNLIERYEAYRKGESGGYFETLELFWLLQYYLEQNDEQKALEIQDLAIQTHPNSEELDKILASTDIYFERLDDAVKRLKTYPHDDIFAQLLLLHTYLRMGKRRLAKDVLNNIILSEWFDVEIAKNIAEDCLTLEEYKLGYYFTKSILTFFPDDDNILLQYGMFCQAEGKFKEAEKTYKRVIDSNPFTATTWFHLAGVYGSTNRYKEGLEAIDYALAINPHCADWLITKSTLQCANGLHKEAIQTLLTAMQEGEDQEIVYNNIGINYMFMEEHENALEWFNKALELNPQNTTALEQEFKANIALKRFDEAEKDIKKLKKIIDDDVKILELYSILSDNKGDTEETKKYLKKILRRDSRNLTSLIRMGFFSWDEGKYDKSRQYFLEALELDNGFALGYVFYTASIYKLGKYNLLLKLVNDDFLKSPLSKIFFELCPELKTNFKEILNAIKHKKNFQSLLDYSAESDDNNCSNE